eukprot:3811857-Rhodomonas_salina.1
MCAFASREVKTVCVEACLRQHHTSVYATVKSTPHFDQHHSQVNTTLCQPRSQVNTAGVAEPVNEHPTLDVNTACI